LRKLDIDFRKKYICADFYEAKMKPPLLPIGGATEFIRAAERSIAAGNLNMALQQIASARSLDPTNEYLEAIVERIQLLASRKDQGRRNGIVESSPIGSNTAQGPTPNDLSARVKRLTNVAVNLFERGSYETAFDSLMKAYLLDPTSTYVQNCEKTLLPAIELMRKRGTISAQAVPEQPAMEQQAQQADSLESTGTTNEPAGERAMWREASRPINPPGNAEDPPRNDQSNPEPNTKQAGGFFSKLRRGKLLE
jgi:tetratricopeptide (TPR) repeat protein